MTWRGLPADRVRGMLVLMGAQGVNLAGVLAVTRIFTPGAFGRFSELLAVAVVVGTTSSLRLDVAATTAPEADVGALFRTACRLNVLIGSGVAVVGLGWAATVGHGGPAALGEWAATGALTVTIGLSTTLTFARVRDRRYLAVAASKLAVALVQLVVQVGIGLRAPTSGGLLLAAALGYGVGALLLSGPGSGRAAAGPAGPAAGAAVAADPATAASGRVVLGRYRGLRAGLGPRGLNALTMNLPVLAVSAVGGSAAARTSRWRCGSRALPSALFGQALMPVLLGEITYRLRSAPAAALLAATGRCWRWQPPERSA
jgi:hypothetical protein